jgi:hypothetical protein
MIQEISLDLFGSRFAVFAPKPGAEDIKLAKALTEDAAKNAAEAGKQQEYAEIARTFIANAENDESRAALTRIAVGHYERCAAGFRNAVVSFESAAKIQTTEIARRKLLEKAETLAESAMQAELAVLELKTGGEKTKGGLNDETG